MTPACSDCRYREVIIAGDDDDAEPVMECRRHPPTVVLWNDDPIILWPQVSEGDWCGDFQP
jgi:hypothetical protein